MFATINISSKYLVNLKCGLTFSGNESNHFISMCAQVPMQNFNKSLKLYSTAVKSNALAELMNRASKIHWKNLSLTLNGRNSETKNDKNNPKVPKFSSCRGLSSTLSRKCGRTTLCGCLWVFCGCLWVFLGVCGC